MKKSAMLLAAAALVVAAIPALAQKKQLAIVVKGRDLAHFAAVEDGCARWNKDNPKSEYECFYTGPASAADEFGELQLVDDLITTGAAAIAIAPSNPASMADLLKRMKPAMPIMTLDSDLEPGDQALRETYLAGDEYAAGQKLGEVLLRLKPTGGPICLQLGTPGDQRLATRAAGFRDFLAARKGTERLTGRFNWTELPGCPLYSMGQAELANRQITETLAAYPEIRAFVLMGGWAQSAPKVYAKTTGGPVAARLKNKSLVIIGADLQAASLEALKAGRTQAQVGLRTYALGYQAASVMVDLVDRLAVADPLTMSVEVCTAENVAACLKR